MHRVQQFLQRKNLDRGCILYLQQRSLVRKEQRYQCNGDTSSLGKHYTIDLVLFPQNGEIFPSNTSRSFLTVNTSHICSSMIPTSEVKHWRPEREKERESTFKG